MGRSIAGRLGSSRGQASEARSVEVLSHPGKSYVVFLHKLEAHVNDLLTDWFAIEPGQESFRGLPAHQGTVKFGGCQRKDGMRSMPLIADADESGLPKGWWPLGLYLCRGSWCEVS